MNPEEKETKSEEGYKNECECGDFSLASYVMSVCGCGRERECIYCKNCGRTRQVGGHVGCGYGPFDHFFM